MAFSPASWIRDTKAVYFGNASNVRDFRTQLRGNRPIYLWLSYLGIFILVVGLAYYNIEDGQTASVAVMQSRLTEFYQIIMALLGGLIAIVTPSLTATTVVAERQRKSLDLVFSAPVSYKYYLVGKMLSSMRYTWMLLILALPVTSVCVVMGGATWQDVLGAYVLLTGASLVFTSLGLLISVLTNTLVSAVLWTYVVAGIYCIVTVSMTASSLAMSMMGRGSFEMNWMVGISPFTVSFASPTYTTLWGHQIPNWVFVMVYSIMICKLFLAGAASSMSPYGTKDTRSFRLHLVAYSAVLIYIVGIAVIQPVASMVALGPPTPASRINYLWLIPAWIVFAMTLGMPTYACFNNNEDRKFRNDGTFSISKIFVGSPAGALPFALLVACVIYLALAFASASGRIMFDQTTMFCSWFWSCSYIFFWWSIARLSSVVATTLKMARVIYTALFIVIVALPLPILSIVQSSKIVSGTSEGASAYQLHMLYPITQVVDTQLVLLAYSILMLIPAISVATVSQVIYSRKNQ